MFPHKLPFCSVGFPLFPDLCNFFLSHQTRKKERKHITMITKLFLLLMSLSLFCGTLGCVDGVSNLMNIGNSNESLLTSGIQIPDHSSFNAVSASADSGCSLKRSKKVATDVEVEEEKEESRAPVKLHLKHHRWAGEKGEGKKSVFESTARDQTRIQTLHRRMTEKKNLNRASRLEKEGEPYKAAESEYRGQGQLMATLESGVSAGSGEYFMDVFVGTPPRHFSLILDTGSDLNWIQCLPCHDCYEQSGPPYDPKRSTSFRNVGCHDPRCTLVSSPDPPQPCKAQNQTCPYFYWYGDSSNTTGDFALETFTVNLTTPDGKSGFRRVEDVMFGCGHWNRGLFHGAAGLLGLGRGPLSFSSQLQSLHGHSFSYCLVDRNSNSSVSSKLIFGEEQEMRREAGAEAVMNFTGLVGGKDNPGDTFYYVQIKWVVVGGEVVSIPEEAWRMSAEGVGGTIVDSGTTLSYFAEPAYTSIREAFASKIKGYPLVEDFPILSPCYNVSETEKLELPSFGIVFGDGAVWNFPVENYFIRVEAEEVVCLAMLGTPRSALSIIGNYQQQNFHVLYDTKKSRLGFASASCADL